MRVHFALSLILALLILTLTVLGDGMGITGWLEAQFRFDPRNWAAIGYALGALALTVGGFIQWRTRTPRIILVTGLTIGAVGVSLIPPATLDPHSLQYRHFHCSRLLRSIFLRSETQQAFENYRASLTPRQNFWIAQASAYCRMLEVERGFHASPSRTLTDYLKTLEQAHALAPLTLTEWLYAQETVRQETFETESFLQGLESKTRWTAKSALFLTQLAPMLPPGQELSLDEKKTIVLQLIPAMGTSVLFKGIDRFL